MHLVKMRRKTLHSCEAQISGNIISGLQTYLDPTRMPRRWAATYTTAFEGVPLTRAPEDITSYVV